MANRKKNSQSILEYILFLSAVIFILIGATVGLRGGMSAGLESAQAVAEDRVRNVTRAPEEIEGRDYHQHSEVMSFDQEEAKRVQYAQYADAGSYYHNFDPDRYYFHEGASDMSYVDQKYAGRILDEDHSYVASPPAGDSDPIEHIESPDLPLIEEGEIVDTGDIDDVGIGIVITRDQEGVVTGWEAEGQQWDLVRDDTGRVVDIQEHGFTPGDEPVLPASEIIAGDRVISINRDEEGVITGWEDDEYEWVLIEDQDGRIIGWEVWAK